MTDTNNEEPLDPKVEAIRQKMVRLLMVSGGIMMLGLMAVFIAVVYKINRNKPSLPVIAIENNLSIPKGAQVLSAQNSETGLTLTLKQQDGSTRIQVHQPNGKLAHSYTIIEN